MSEPNVPITVEILDKEYRIACPKEEVESLRASALYLNTRIQEIRDSGKAIGTDRIAVMTALNLAHDVLSREKKQDEASAKLASRYKALQQRIDLAIQSARQLEF